jgi:HSP20 family molecular chaperone IbpA
MKRTASKKNKNLDPRFILDSKIDYEEQEILSEFINWQPLYNLYTTPDSIIVHLELPGVNLQDVVIYLRSRYMVVTGNRKAPTELKGECCVFHSLEIPYGRFSRRIDFPVPIEIRRYNYDVQDSILTLQFQALVETIIPVEGD